MRCTNELRPRDFDAIWFALAHLGTQIREQSDGPKRWIGRFLMENFLATARSSVALVTLTRCR